MKQAVLHFGTTLIFLTLSNSLALGDGMNGGAFTRGRGNHQQAISFLESGTPRAWNGFIGCLTDCATQCGITVSDLKNSSVPSFQDLKSVIGGGVSRGYGNSQSVIAFSGEADLPTWKTLGRCVDTCGADFEISIGH